MGYILECCVDSVESAIAAKKGGADRIELCSALVIGGLSPSQALYQKIREQVDIPIRVLLRPRFGDFCYTDFEQEILKEEIRSFVKLGADGIVIGAMKADGTLHLEQMKEFIEEAKGTPVTLHRAFDMCKDPFVALEEAKKTWNLYYPDLRTEKYLCRWSGTFKRTGGKSTGKNRNSHWRRCRRICTSYAGREDESKSLSYVRKNFYGKSNALSETGCEHGSCICKRI